MVNSHSKTYNDWMSNFSDIKDYIKTHNCFPVGTERTKLGRKMDTWLNCQIRKYQRDKLSSYQVKALNEFLPEGWYNSSVDKLNVDLIGCNDTEEIYNDISTKSLYESGVLSLHDYSYFLSRGIFYLRGILSYKRSFFKEEVLYEILKEKLDLPDIMWYRLYKVAYRYSLNIKDIFIKGYWDSLESLRRFPDEYIKASIIYLPYTESRVVDSIYLKGRSVKEIATMLSLSPQEVEDLLCNALKILRRKECTLLFNYSLRARK